MSTVVALTAEEFVTRFEKERAELVAGTVVELPVPGYYHGVVCSNIAFELNVHVRQHELGTVVTNDSFIQTQRGPDSVRGPDVAFFSYERMPRGSRPAGLPPVSPDLVVEVRSPSDRLSTLNAKALEYLAAGVRVVLLLDPELAAATIFRDDELPQTLHNGDVLELPELLPGFRVPLANLFV